MVNVQVKQADSLEKYLRIFKKKVEREGIIKDTKNKRYYTKPSQKRRLAKQAAKTRH